MTYRSHIVADVFAKIQRGDQLIEPRLYDPDHRSIKIGDLILFVNRETKEEALAKVVGLLRFDSFVELFNAYPASRFGAESEQELIHAMRQLYSSAQELEHGVVGVKVHILRNKTP